MESIVASPVGYCLLRERHVSRRHSTMLMHYLQEAAQEELRRPDLSSGSPSMGAGLREQAEKLRLLMILNIC